jgi:hypothetical protein
MSSRCHVCENFKDEELIRVGPTSVCNDCLKTIYISSVEESGVPVPIVDNQLTRLTIDSFLRKSSLSSSSTVMEFFRKCIQLTSQMKAVVRFNNFMQELLAKNGTDSAIVIMNKSDVSALNDCDIDCGGSYLQVNTTFMDIFEESFYRLKEDPFLNPRPVETTKDDSGKLDNE